MLALIALVQSMPGKQAKILSDENINDLLAFAETTRHPLRNKIIVLLSAKAGLRAGQIAHLTWDMVSEPNGAIGAVVELRDRSAKRGSGRIIPLHPDLRRALAEWRAIAGTIGPVIANDWPRRLLIAFRTADVHHPRCSTGAQSRWFVARCSAARF